MYECVCLDFDCDEQQWQINKIVENWADPSFDPDVAPKCCECGEFVPYEDSMDVACVCSEGKVTAYYTCSTCNKIREDIFQCGFIYGSMYEELASRWEVAIGDLK